MSSVARHVRRGLSAAAVAAVTTGIAVSLAGTASAATVRYVSSVGDDSGDCTMSPCRTIGYAIGQSTSGDTIRIAAGLYAEHLVVDRSLALAGI